MLSLFQLLHVRLKSVFREMPLEGVIVHVPPVGADVVDMSYALIPGKPAVVSTNNARR